MTDHVAVNERVRLLGEHRSLGRQIKGSGFKWIDPWGTFPGDIRQSQNLNSSGNAVMACPKQTSFLPLHSDHQDKAGMMSVLSLPLASSPSPLPPAALHSLALALHHLLSKMTFHLHLQQVLGCLPWAKTANLAVLPSDQPSPFIHKLMNGAKALFGQLVLYPAHLTPPLCSTEQNEDQKMIQNIPPSTFNSSKYLGGGGRIPSTVLTHTSVAQTWIKTAEEKKKLSFFQAKPNTYHKKKPTPLTHKLLFMAQKRQFERATQDKEAVCSQQNNLWIGVHWMTEERGPVPHNSM